jgi:hypothetical protein
MPGSGRITPVPELASSNPFSVLQNRVGGQGLGYVVTPDKISSAVNKIAREVRTKGRPRRSPSGKRHDGVRVNLYINEKICKKTKKITDSLATSAALFATSTGEVVLQNELRAKNERMHNCRRFLFDFCQCADVKGVDYITFIEDLVFRTPTGEELLKMKYSDIKYLGHLSPELLRRMLMLRLAYSCSRPEGNHLLYKRLPFVSEIRRLLLEIAVRVLRLIKVQVFSLDPRLNGDAHVLDNVV